MNPNAAAMRQRQRKLISKDGAAPGHQRLRALTSESSDSGPAMEAMAQQRRRCPGVLAWVLQSGFAKMTPTAPELPRLGGFPLDAGIAAKGTEGADVEDSDGTTSDDAERVMATKAQCLLGRSRVRFGRCLAVCQGLPSDVLLQERLSVGSASQAPYAKELEALHAHRRSRWENGGSDEEIDTRRVEYMNKCYPEGEQAWKGEKLLAAFCCRLPGFPRCDGRRMPRAWKCLRGWQGLTPCRPRRPLPRAVWCGIAGHMASSGWPASAVGVLLAVTCYLRPGELPRMKHSSGSIPVDLPHAAWMMPALEALRGADVVGAPWHFDYVELLKRVRGAARQLQLGEVVPCRMRHSGPSVDRSSGLRPLAEIQRRGRWASSSSVPRYEKGAGLQAAWDNPDYVAEAHLVQAEERIDDMVFGRRGAPPGVPCL